MSVLNRRNKLLSSALGSVGVLTKEYQRVEYLETTGAEGSLAAYILLRNNFLYKNDICEIVAMPLSSKSYSTIWAIPFRSELYFQGNSVNVYNKAGANTQLVYPTSHSAPVNQISTIRIAIGLDGVTTMLGAYDADGSFPLHGRIYSYKVFRNDEMIYNYIPCYRKSDNITGVYETVEGKFFARYNDNEFIVGGNV